MSENENNWEVIFFKESVEGVNVVKSAKKSYEIETEHCENKEKGKSSP